MSDKKYDYQIGPGWKIVSGLMNVADIPIPEEFKEKSYVAAKQDPISLTWEFKEISLSPRQIKILKKWLESLSDKDV